MRWKERLVAAEKFFIPAFFGLAAFLFMTCGTSLLFLNTTESLPRGLYLMIPSTSIRCGDYAVYEIPDSVRQLCMERNYHPAKDGKPILFLKRVGALPGDLYEVRQDFSFLIEGKLVGKVEKVDSKGRIMPIQFGMHIVPEGEFLPCGIPSNSLDGRYTGPVPLENIRARAVPIFTEFP